MLCLWIISLPLRETPSTFLHLHVKVIQIPDAHYSIEAWKTMTIKKGVELCLMQCVWGVLVIPGNQQMVLLRVSIILSAYMDLHSGTLL